MASASHHVLARAKLLWQMLIFIHYELRNAAGAGVDQSVVVQNLNSKNPRFVRTATQQQKKR